MTDDDITAKIDRLEAIIEQLEAGDVPLDRAEELHTEGRELLADLDAELALDDAGDAGDADDDNDEGGHVVTDGS